ncbi:MAG: ATP synthase F1 subunit delta [Treponema sp.]|jgi:F-type H+-transporting ATPase subunit delta|nr:ATP synthase F1 subunit delta [Treponema sp.]
MFVPQRWAAAFINSMGAEADEGFALLRILSDWIKELPGAVFGSYAAERLERLIAEGAEKAGAGIPEKCSRFVCLLVRKDLFKHIDPVLGEIEKILNEQKNILPVIAESALPLEGELEAFITGELKKQKKAAEVKLENRINPALIGGLRLRIGDEVIDASLRGQLQRMAADLAAGASFDASSGVSSIEGGY